MCESGQLADLDFRLVVIEGYCADYDAEVQKVRCEKMVPKQTEVRRAEAMTSTDSLLWRSKGLMIECKSIQEGPNCSNHSLIRILLS